MNNLLSYFIEANLYLICFYLLYQILLVRDKHFRFNRAYLLGAVLLSLGLPLLSVDISSAETMEGYIILPVITITEAQTEGIGYILKWWHIFGFVYILGVTFYLSKLLWQMAQIVRRLPLLNSSRERKNGYTLITTNGEIPTCSFFKYLFWDKSALLSKEEQKQIFEHEIAHIRQWHSVDVLLIEVLRAIFWFNPAIHLIKSRITEVHEYLADHHATKKIGIENYSKLLALQIFKSFDFALSNNFHKNQVVKRIRMLKSKSTKSIWLNILFLIPIISVLIGLFAFNVNQTNELEIPNEIPRTTIQAPEITAAEIEKISEKDLIMPETNEIFTIVEDQPAPYGGMTDFYYYIQQNVKYPSQAKRMGIQGKVFVQFVVAPDGSLTEVKSVKGIGAGCDAEAVRVIENSPKWKPGKQRGKAVNVRMILPITFKLD